ncbi:tRNA-queuosine alpha-mannosyltransferase domain-containing protein [Marinagarivorans algicola]|uniref:tRNA-queuosine alpha-mannosyltransferase domain-containing protein n=1 Tax=Marinagarivorans algicola TaxID=1513270 RepID=UPI0006B46D3C|nr:DUF3524 domain-containing protein [Marinagarivorans algicola]
MVNILVLSAYDADSHKRWHQGLVRYLKNECLSFGQPLNFTVLTLPARFFSWRIRGNALSWALGKQAVLQSQKWNAIIATSMVDLATLKGLVPCLASVPTCVYFHENQFAYPTTSHGHNSIEPQMVTLYSALAANKVCFNSEYNKSTFLAGVAALLKKLPDQIPFGIVENIQQKSQVLPVPIEPEYFALADNSQSQSTTLHSADTLKFPRELTTFDTLEEPLTIVWNHRWEYDKCPELLLAIVQQLDKMAPHLNLRWHVVGQRFRQVPKAFEALQTLLMQKNWLGEWGYLPRPEYLSVLKSSHIVLSTAAHDFQGLAVMDAVAAGCVPLLPHRVAYPEFFAGDYLFGSAGACEAVTQKECLLAEQAAHAIINHYQGANPLSAPNIDKLNWLTLKQQYAQLFDTLVTHQY